MKKIILLSLILASTNAFALKIKCEVDDRTRNASETTKIPVKYQDNMAYIHSEVNGNLYGGSCGEETCDISIKNLVNPAGFFAVNGAFSELNDNSISASVFGLKGEVSEITCKKLNN